MAFTNSKVRCSSAQIESEKQFGFDFKVVVRDGIGMSILVKTVGEDATQTLIDHELNRMIRVFAENEQKTFEKLSNEQIVDKVCLEANDAFVLALSLTRYLSRTDEFQRNVPGVSVKSNVV